MPDRGTSAERIAVGEVVGAHGVRGLLRVRSYNAASDLLATLETLGLRDGDGTVEVHRVTRATPHGRGTWLVELESVADRAAADALAHRDVVVPTETLPELADDEFYHHELHGFTVETTAGVRLGTIAETLSTGLNDVWVVRDGRREHLVPVIADVVHSIERDARRVVVVPVDGLLD